MNAKTLMLVGLIIFVLGAIIYLLEKYDMQLFKWLGNLPGDIKIERENFKFYFPFTTMILCSLALSLLIKIINKFF